MLLSTFRRRLGRSFLWWCVCATLLCAVQPFIAIHFRHDGWEDEPAFRVRATGSTVEYEPDERPDHAARVETTLFVPTAAHIDVPHALQHGLDLLLALVLLLAPFTVALRRRSMPAARTRLERVSPRAGAPPPTVPWRRLPPETAPPSTR